jgi:hypothetical protein
MFALSKIEYEAKCHVHTYSSKHNRTKVNSENFQEDLY